MNNTQMTLYQVKGYNSDIKKEVSYDMVYCNESSMILKLYFKDSREVSSSIV